MSNTLDSFLDANTADEEADAPDTAPEPEAEAPAPKPGAEAPPAPAPEPADDVPDDVRGLRAAVQATRRERNDYKGERDRLTGEKEQLAAERDRLRADLEAARKVVAVPPQPASPPPEPVRAPNQYEDPEGYAQWRDEQDFAKYCNLSMVSARRFYPDFDEKLQIWKQAIASNPALAYQLRTQDDPAEFAYQHAKSLQAMQEMGPDPAAFREKTRAEIRAEVEAELRAEMGTENLAPARPVLPQSLANARSAGPRVQAVADAPEFSEIFAPRKRR